jgi:NADPH-dependent 2,4-dienoyl-CoA reductase/sulfur reductase-like enzyme
VTRLRHVVVVGGGLGGVRTVDGLRQEGFEGKITLVCAEARPPYDRPPLSKDVLAGKRAPESISLWPLPSVPEGDVDLLLGSAASGLDLDRRRVVLVDGTELDFDGLVLATGAEARTLPHLDGRPHVHTLRTLDDALRLKDELRPGRHITVIGAGFIGSEVAATARAAGCEVTLVELDATPLAQAVGPELGGVLMDVHRENGIELRLGTTVASIDGDESLRLTLADETELETDAVVIGIGVVPNVSWLEDAALGIENGVVCSADLSAGPEGVYAIGDLANWPNELFGSRMRVEHWMNTFEQARHAARNLVRGTADPFRGSNYVWSDQHGLRIQFAGVRSGEVEIVDGSIDERRFLAWYRTGDRLVGAFAIGSPRLLMHSKKLIEEASSWDDAAAALDETQARSSA